MRNLFLVVLFALGFITKAQKRTADSLYAIGDYSAALQSYKNIPQTAAVAFQIARVYKVLGNYNNAATFYGTGLKTDSLNVLATFEYGKLLLDDNKKQDAKKVFDKLILKHPKTSAYYFYAGKAVDDSDHLQESIPLYEKAVELNPEFSIARNALVTNYLLNRKYLYGVDSAIEGLKYDPNDITMYSLLAQCYYHYGNYVKAIVNFEKVATAGLATEGIYKLLGNAYYQNNDFQKAIDTYKTVLNKKEDAAVYMMISKAYLQLKDYKNALGYIETAVVLKQPKLNEEYKQLAMIFRKTEQTKQELEYLKKAKSEDPNDAIAAYWYCTAYDRYYSDITSKINVYEQFLKDFPNDPYEALTKQRISDLIKQRFLEVKK